MARLGPMVDLKNHTCFGLENHMVEPYGWSWNLYVLTLKTNGWTVWLVLKTIYGLVLKTIYGLVLKTIWFSRSSPIWFDLWLTIWFNHMTRFWPMVDFKNHIWFGLENHMVEPYGWPWNSYIFWPWKPMVELRSLSWKPYGFQGQALYGSTVWLTIWFNIWLTIWFSKVKPYIVFKVNHGPKYCNSTYITRNKNLNYNRYTLCNTSFSETCRKLDKIVYS